MSQGHVERSQFLNNISGTWKQLRIVTCISKSAQSPGEEWRGHTSTTRTPQEGGQKWGKKNTKTIKKGKWKCTLCISSSWCIALTMLEIKHWLRMDSNTHGWLLDWLPTQYDNMNTRSWKASFKTKYCKDVQTRPSHQHSGYAGYALLFQVVPSWPVWKCLQNAQTESPMATNSWDDLPVLPAFMSHESQSTTPLTAYIG